MNFICENCGWSEIVGSPIMCNYSGYRTWRDECCEAWKPKDKETNMVEVVRCKDCKHHREGTCEVLIGRASEWTDYFEGYIDFEPTHWMQMPEPPEEV